MIENITEEGRRLSAALADLFNKEGADENAALMAMMCISAAIIVDSEDGDDDKIKWLMGNLTRLTQSYRLFRESKGAPLQ